MKKLILLMPLALFAACSVPLGGSGQMSDGKPIVMQRIVHLGYEEDFTLSSPEGWSCKAKLDWQKHLNVPKTTTARLPLTCDNGQTGNAIITVAHLNRAYVSEGASSISFALKNGKSGLVRF